MTMNEYQHAAMTTCLPTCENPIYMLFNLMGEVGELASKYAKLIRKGFLVYDNNQFTFTERAINELSKEDYDKLESDLIGEMGDIAWQLAGFIHVCGYSFEDICKHNLDKLASRQQRGVIDGNGDNR